ncbi:MAG: aldo/keto reductase [Ignavibacteriae bacterium HGW-Ignavibacteriae-3]|nr:MAG: aldo/keto reductase [Ignavibacteriae bacterium HGW-Ignavibacteriae-3]
MIKRKLGSSDLNASILGLGCMGMSEWYGPTNDEESISTIFEALDNGLNFFDTADVYGNGHNEILVGKALKKRRDEAIIATKFGFLPNEAGISGRPEYAKAACEASLKRLNIDCIDLYYLHRIDPQVPVEESVGAMSDLINEGKIKYIGLSEASAESIKRAYKIHPITALQTEYSIWVRDIECDILQTCRERNVAVVPYSPLGRGFLTGKVKDTNQFDQNDFRKKVPLFEDENFRANLKIVEVLEQIAADKKCTPGQLALSWLFAQGDDVFPIPGTKRRKYLLENIQSAELKLTERELSRIDLLAKQIKGKRKSESGMKLVDG